MGWEKVDGLAYIFTKEYRKRPDSLKQIPSLKQMILKDQLWMLNESPYTGRYIDFYNNGKIQNEGTLENGKINGQLTVYYKTGIKKSITNYKDGIRDGLWIDYYSNGTLLRRDEYVNGKANGKGKSYFINGQLMHELRPKSGTDYDTSVSYYSTGKLREMAITKTGEFHPDKKQNDLNYHNTMFYQHIRTGDLKAANKDFYQIWLADSTNIDSYFKEGLLLSYEFRFDEAIAQFDKALTIEPLMKETLEHRALTRVKKYKFQNNKIPVKDRYNIGLTLADLFQMPKDEQAKVCTDILLADAVDPGVNYNNKMIPEAFLNHCRKKNIR